MVRTLSIILHALAVALIAKNAVEAVSCLKLSSIHTKAEPSKAKMTRILCLHGKSQNGASFRSKIGGARRKLERKYELDFLDAPIALRPDPAASSEAGTGEEPETDWGRAWFLRDNVGDGKWRYHKIDEAVKYVSEYAKVNGPYDALLGFSQGGTLTTSLAATGSIPGIKCVVTAGSPYVPDTLLADNVVEEGMRMPKLHLAGETDSVVPIESTKMLCEHGGNGEFYLHDKGHMFPTKAAHVGHILQFLGEHLSPV